MSPNRCSNVLDPPHEINAELARTRDSSARPRSTRCSRPVRPRTTPWTRYCCTDFGPNRSPSSAGTATTRNRARQDADHTSRCRIGDRARLLGPDGLTRHASTFDRRDIIAPGAASSPQRRHQRHRTARRPDPRRPDVCAPPPPYSTALSGRYADAERTSDRHTDDRTALLDPRPPRPRRSSRGRAVADTDQPLGIADEDSVVAALTSRPTLSEEQLEMVATLTTSGRAVDVVIAAAGTGKTFSLDAARDAWRRSGHLVLGTALSARAAAELETTAGIPSHTITSLLADLDHSRRGPFPPNTVLVVDEAGMVGTRQLARVLDHAAAAHAKVVLVGDPRQLPEIDAGGLLAVSATACRPSGSPRIDVNASVGRDPLAQLRDGRVDDAVAAYHEHGRIRTDRTATRGPERDDRRLVGRDARRRPRVDARNTLVDVDDLNARAPAYLQEAGKLSGPVLTVDERPYQAGDRIMTLRNDRRLGVRNGTCVTSPTLTSSGVR